MGYDPPPALLTDLARIRAYSEGMQLVDADSDAGVLRRRLAAFLVEHGPSVIEPWVRQIGPTLGIAPSEWPGIQADQGAALERWARHIADPADIETFEHLRRHTRRGFIAQFPASRFLSAQMRLVRMLEDALCARMPGEEGHRLARLLAQEFEVRILHTTDFFVEGREELLLEQETSYRRWLDLAPACIVRAAVGDGRVSDINAVGERVLGLDRRVLIGRLLHELHPPGERAAVDALLARIRDGHHGTWDGLHLLRRTGAPLPVFVSAGPIDYANQHLAQIVYVDLSERMRLENQLVQSEKMAAIGQLAAGIAHELRNPLAIVMNALFDLRQQLGTPTPGVAEDLHIAEEEIERAQVIIRNLLEFSRTSGAEVERIDINDLLQRTVQLLQKYMQNNGVRVVTELGDIPLCAANSNAMRQILLNLLTNAVQAMPDGGELRLRTGHAGRDRIRLEVEDTGVGIAPENMKNIFDPFYTTKAPGQGTGLGLSVVHSVVRRYGGDIIVDSRPGVGTTFRIELPCPCHRGIAAPSRHRMSAAPRILLVEDEVNMARTLAKNLERAGYVITHASEGAAALARLQEEPFDVVVTDLKMPGMDGMTLLHELHEKKIPVAVIVLTGFGTIESAVEAMKLGAADYLIKDARPAEVLLTLERVLRFESLRRENARLREQLRRTHGFGELIGVSAPMHAVYRLVDAVSQNKSTVLVSGESGTGKELVARTIHERSALRDGPFVPVNCAGLAETLLDSQLFGHRRGAFTGAIADHDGVFRAASGGTLFLDEVAEVPFALQAKFLRAIQEREVVPIGSTRAIPVDVRLIAATNRDIEAEVDAGRFRRDLFYRLNVVRIELPPLRARPDDIPALVTHFIDRYSTQYGVAPKAVPPAVLTCLQSHQWPGNVRELQNVVERAFALSDADTLALTDLPAALRSPTAPAGAARPTHGRHTLDESERTLIADTLAATGGNKNETARRLGIDRQRLYRKLRKYGLG